MTLLLGGLPDKKKNKVSFFITVLYVSKKDNLKQETE